ncbi:MAG: flagellar export protein FliJ [Xanthomonadaceae bacterium]|nr:flagellar export protein FliJ [Xanthomonadaceae bacterium]
MSASRRIQRLGQLVALRERDVERLGAEMAEKRATQQRYLNNLARLDELCLSSGASGMALDPGQPQKLLSPALSLNVGGYKQAVMNMAAAHRVDLSLHEAEMLNTQRLMTAAARRHEALDQALTRRRAILQRHRAVREQKRQDDLAAQVWLRRHK